MNFPLAQIASRRHSATFAGHKYMSGECRGVTSVCYLLNAAEFSLVVFQKMGYSGEPL